MLEQEDHGAEDDDEDLEDENNEDDEDENEEVEDENDEDEAISGSPDLSLRNSDRDDLEVYLTNGQESEDFDDSYNSINFEYQVSAIQQACHTHDLAMAPLSSDQANQTIIAFVKHHIRKQKQTEK